MAVIDRLRQRVRERDYFLSSHAEEEMVDDRLSRSDVEQAILSGTVEKKLTRDRRGSRYRVIGHADDGRPVCVICRFHELGGLIIITVYVPEQPQ